MKLSDWIRDARESTGMSQHALAMRLHTDQGLVSRWETGLVTPRTETIIRIAQVTNVPLPVAIKTKLEEWGKWIS